MLESLKQNDGRKVYSFSGMLGMKRIYTLQERPCGSKHDLY